MIAGRYGIKTVRIMSTARFIRRVGLDPSERGQEPWRSSSLDLQGWMDLDRLDRMTTTALELYDRVLELFPDRVSPVL
jgi:hypothetical protein